MRCDYCNKKLKIINFKCRCNKTFCKKCFHPEDHKCTFNYKTLVEQYPKIKTLSGLIPI